MIPPLMFATVIENSDPTVQGATARVDEMEKCGHGRHWRTDFDSVEDLGLWKEWINVLRVRNDGIPIVGFPWYSLTDQVDGDSALRETRGTVNPPGLDDLDRRIRPVGEAYRRIAREWGDVLPTQSVCLRVPVYPPSESERALRRRTRADVPAVEAPATAPSTSDGGH